MSPRGVLTILFLAVVGMTVGAWGTGENLHWLTFSGGYLTGGVLGAYAGFTTYHRAIVKAINAAKPLGVQSRPWSPSGSKKPTPTTGSEGSSGSGAGTSGAPS